VPGVSGLTLSGYFDYNKYFWVRKFWEKPFTLYSLDKQAYLNAGNDGSQDGSAFMIANYPKGEAPEPRLTDSYNESDRKIFNLKANYDKTFGGVHFIDAFISVESMDYMSKGISAFRRYFISDKLPYLFAGGTTSLTNDGSVSIDSRLNYFGRVMYNYKETYLLQFSLRRDGSLRFSKESGRWGTFPSVLVGWRISNESFWKNNVKFIDYLKLKASFGKMGNDQVSAFQYLTSYGFGMGQILGSSPAYVTGLLQTGNPNPFITWEDANIFNVGFESNLLDNKLTFNTDFFYERRSNILVKRNASVPSYTGIALPDENFGIVDNKGFEIELGYNDRKGDFSYGINGNIAFAHNKIIEYDEPARSVPWQVLTGHPTGSFLLYKSAGIFRDAEQVNSMPHVSGARPGDIIIQDVSGDGNITSDDQIIIDKTADPELTYGLSFSLGYKNWNLKGLIQGTGTTMLSMASDVLTGTVGNYFAYEAEDRWTPDNIDATKPRAYERQEEYWRANYTTDYNYQKGGYARLKNIQLSYSIPQQLLKVIMMKDAQVYFSGDNLFLIYSQNKIQDPESGSMEIYPIMRVLTFGVRVTF
jgi:TonB-linked SusC/RagA family outer membrane protein